MTHKTKPQETRARAQAVLTAQIADITPTQETAMNLYGLGMNVFPLPYGKKGGYPWQILQYTRLNPEDIYPLFRDNCNMAVMTGRTSGNLFVIDCETKETFEYHQKLLKDAGIPVWSVISGGRRGGGHLYLRCTNGEVKNIKAGERKDYEVRGNRCYVLAPPSLHPDTHQLYQWGIREVDIPPAVTLEQVRFLGLELTKDKRKQPLPQPFAELSTITRDFLYNGTAVGERNNRLFTAACDLAGNDYDIHAAMQLLLPICQKVDTPEREARATIASAYSKPRTPAKPTAQREHKPPAWQIAQTWAQGQKWSDRAGQTDRAVFLACCERAKTANEKGIFRASNREIVSLQEMNVKS